MSPSDLTAPAPRRLRPSSYQYQAKTALSYPQASGLRPTQQGRPPQQAVWKPAHPGAVVTVMGNHRCPRRGQIPAVNRRTGPDVLPAYRSPIRHN